MSEDSAPGWEAIDAALAGLYGDQEPLHVAPKLPMMVGGDDPLDGISAFAVDDPPHWHLVTYGMTELYAKESENLEESGWGFEFTVRLERKGERPPVWVFSFLQNLARYVYRTGNWFEAGHQMDLNGPIAVGEDTRIRAILFVEDPSLRTIDTPHGRVQFLQIVGITPDEREAAIRWNVDGVAELLGRVDAHRIVALGRKSILDDPALEAAANEGMERDGSSCGFLFGGLREVSVDPLRIVMGANQVESLAAVLAGRIPYGMPLGVAGEDGLVLTVYPSQEVAAEAEDEPGQFTLELTAEAAREIGGTLLPKRGSYRFESAPNLEIVVQPSEITGPDGQVVKVVG